MVKIEIYTGNLCGYCTAAKRLLKQKSAVFSETNVHNNTEKKSEMFIQAKPR